MTRRALALALAIVALNACSDKIPGQPEKVLEKYIVATQKGDFDTIYLLHQKTARQKKYLSRSKVGDIAVALRDNKEKNRADYKSVKPALGAAVRWAEKYYFPASSTAKIGKPHFPAPAGEDDFNALYERAANVIVPVVVEYGSLEEAPELNERKIKSTRYDCSMRKIRAGKNVRVYSDDEEWYFAGCAIDADSVSYFSGK